jgi:hypothetical protein
VAAFEQAAPAFVDAALETDHTRTIDLDGPTDGGMELRGLLWPGDRHVDASELREWHGRGIRILALVRDDGLQPLSFPPAPLEPGDHAVLVGPREALDQARQPPWSRNGGAPHLARHTADEQRP